MDTIATESIKKIGVEITSTQTEARAQGEIQVQFWNKKERLMRGIAFGVLCWLAAIVSVFIPMLHFILVPGFFIAGPIVASVIAGKQSAVLGGEGTCPVCQEPLPIVSAPYRFPITDMCTHCQNRLKISPTAA